MAEVNPFDPPDPEANVPKGDKLLGRALDPEERVRQAFQQLRIEDRRMASPMNWLTQGSAFPNIFDPIGSPYHTPESAGYAPEDQRPILAADLKNPIAVQMGINDIPDLPARARAMAEYNRRMEAKREADKKRRTR